MANAYLEWPFLISESFDYSDWLKKAENTFIKKAPVLPGLSLH